MQNLEVMKSDPLGNLHFFVIWPKTAEEGKGYLAVGKIDEEHGFRKCVQCKTHKEAETQIKEWIKNDQR